jgi:alkylation response protein AidB-like acyl-CoA dehydrogenase
MDFDLDPIEQQVADSYARFFSDQVPLSRVRAAEPLGFDQALWQRLVESRVIGMALPADSGGDGGQFIHLVLAAEQYGRRLAPAPLIEASVCARVLAQFGEVSTASSALAALLCGADIATLALTPLAGETPLLAAGAVARWVVGIDDGRLVVAKLEGPAPYQAIPNLGSSPLARRTVAARPEAIAEGDTAWQCYRAALREWKILTAAALVGLAQHALEITLEYVKHRRAFGTPIGGYQAVAHRLADDIVEIDGSRFLCYEAGWAVDSAAERSPALASMAYVQAVETARRVTSDGLHMHGGIGYTMEHDIQLFFRRAKAWPLALGTPSAEYEVLAAELFGPVH